MNTILNKLSNMNLEVKKIAEDVISFLVANGQNPTAENIDTIRIALFGQFNSGKSTLVNALVGERVAISGDAPETKVPHIYKWKGLEILDLPGLDARTEEEKEALEALKNSHVVLYVISSVTGLDYDSIWTDLEKLSRNGIPFLVVINDKKAHQDIASEQNFRQRLLEHFLELAGSRLPDQNWTDLLFWINARIAEKGRLEGKHLLVERSGILDLDRRLVETIRDGDLIIKNTAYLRKLQEHLQELITSLKQQESSTDVKLIEDALEKCKMARNRLEAAANNCVDTLITTVKSYVYDKLVKTISSEHKEKEKITEENLNSALEETWRNFLKRCETEFKDLSVQIGLAPDLSRLSYGYDNNIFDQNRRNNESGETSYNRFIAGLGGVGLGFMTLQQTMPELTQRLVHETCDMIATAIGKIFEVIDGAIDGIGGAIEGIGGSSAVSSAGSKAGAQVAAQGSKLAAGTAGAGGSNAAATAGKGAGGSWIRGGGFLIAIVLAGYQIYKGFKDAEKKRQRYSALLKEFEWEAQRVAKAVRDKFLTDAYGLVSEVIRPIEKQFYEQLRACANTEKDIRARMLRAHELSNRLAKLTQKMVCDLGE